MILGIEDGGGLKATIGVVDLFRSNWVFNTGSKIEIDKSKSWTSWDTIQSKHVTQLKMSHNLFSHSISPLEHVIWITRWILLSLSLSAPQHVVSRLSSFSWFSRVEQIKESSNVRNYSNVVQASEHHEPLHHSMPFQRVIKWLRSKDTSPGSAVRLHQPPPVCHLPWAWLASLAIS